MDQPGSVELQQRGIVGEALHRAGVAAWLAQWMGCDVLFGRIMRQHGDIDLVVLDSDTGSLSWSPPGPGLEANLALPDSGEGEAWRPPSEGSPAGTGPQAPDQRR
jgi:hypothetical protein